MSEKSVKNAERYARLKIILSWLSNKEFDDLISYAECEGFDPLDYLAKKIYD